MNWNKIFAVLILLAVIIFILTIILISVAFLFIIFGGGKKKYHCENGKCVAGYSKGKTIYNSDNCDNEC